MSEYSRYYRFIEEILPNESSVCMNESYLTEMHIRYMLNRTNQMFEWSGLPDTIPHRILEIMLQCNGDVLFAEVGNDLYVFNGGLGGEPNVYYLPTIYTVANPALNLSRMFNIDNDSILMLNDSMHVGMIPMYRYYGNSLAINEISMKVASINSRIPSIISAGDDRTKAAADAYIDNIMAGNLSVVASNEFLEGIKTHEFNNTGSASVIKTLIEYEQYLTASWFNKVGLNANYNMKREALNSAESALNDDMLFPTVDNMLQCRMDAAEKVNSMFGTNISVDLGSAWKDNKIELENDLGDADPEDTEVNDYEREQTDDQ